MKRDDLLPFPLAGNKVRKLFAEFESINPTKHHVVTVGAISSNHCRTTAMMCAQRQIPLSLVLHGEEGSGDSMEARMLSGLGADLRIVLPEEISSTIGAICEGIHGREPYVIAGGCHTPAGVLSYRDAVIELSHQLQGDGYPSAIVVACGTGATQAGIVLGCDELGWNTRVIGVSVARTEERASESVQEAIKWVRGHTLPDLPIKIDSSFVAGGYANYDQRIVDAVRSGWRAGLPLDPVYTGKAFAGLLHYAEAGELGSRPVFWHSGGLMQQLVHQVW